MTTFLLVRHAAHELGEGTLPGRKPGVRLNDEGRRQAAALADRLRRVPIDAVHTSPVQRVKETAEVTADRLGLPLVVSDALSEIDYGDWTGESFDALGPVERWHAWNAFRSGTRVPGGELMLTAQSRIVGEMIRLAEERPGARLALFSHGDPIRAAIAYWLGVPLDLFLRIRISLASVSVVHLSERGPSVLGVNDTGEVSLA